MTPILVFQFVSSLSLRSRVSHGSFSRAVWTPSAGLTKDSQLRDRQ